MGWEHSGDEQRDLLIGMRVSTNRLSIRSRSNSTMEPAGEERNLTHRGGTRRDSGGWRGLEEERWRDSNEGLEDNAIIRNYRVRPRFAELSHSVSITGTVIPAYPILLPLSFPPSLPPSLSLSST